jgi:hypothetical protein
VTQAVFRNEFCTVCAIAAECVSAVTGIGIMITGNGIMATGNVIMVTGNGTMVTGNGIMVTGNGIMVTDRTTLVIRPAAHSSVRTLSRHCSI